MPLFLERIKLSFSLWNSEYSVCLTKVEQILSEMILKIVLFVAFSFTVNAENIYINSVRCNFSDQIVHKNISCFAKSYNREVSTLNYIIVFKKPIERVFVSIILYGKQLFCCFISGGGCALLSIWDYLSSSIVMEKSKLVQINGRND